MPGHEILSGSELIETGEATHTLEFLDYFGEKTEDDSGRLHEKSRERRIDNVLFNRLLLDEVEKIDSELRDYDLTYAWLKGGAFLRQSAYPKGIRRLSDLDLLLKKHDLSLWHKVLEGLGYRTHRDPDWIQNSSFSESVSSTFYTKEKHGKTILIDIHWHLVDYPARRAAGRWDFDMKPVFDAIDDRTLAPEHRILYLLDHAFSHEFRFWKFVTDLHHVLTDQTVDSAFLKKEADRTHFEDSLVLGTSFLSLFFDERFPVHFRESLSEFIPEEVGLFEEKALRQEHKKGVCLRQCYSWLNSYRQRFAYLMNVLVPPISAVPRISSDSNFSEIVALYLRRMGRVLSKGPSIWGWNSF